MQHFNYINNELYAEKVPLVSIAKEFGTPCYVYSRTALEENWHAFNSTFGSKPHHICYAVKANSNLAILNILARLGSGFDIVSLGELERVLAAGGNPKKIVFSGVGKQIAEINRALEVDIFCFNVESIPELERIHALAKQKNKIASISLRVNPNIDAQTHPYISTGLHENKFGIEIATVIEICHKIAKMPFLNLTGISCHIGSQLTEIDPFLEAIDCMLTLVNQLAAQDITLRHLNIGGGLGIRYKEEQPPAIKDYITTLCERMLNCPLEIILEPGRAITANTGILLTRVEYLKHTPYKNFAIVDAAMNDLLRPALYNAWQDIMPVQQHTDVIKKTYDIVGPVCESADFLGKNRSLALQADDLLAICSAGAYGFSMSSNYNTRPRIAEIMIDQDKRHLIRKRETIQDLFAHEKIF